MKIQFNTDKNVSWSEEIESSFASLISEELSRFGEQITRLEVHLSDENGNKDGFNDKRCMMEVRTKGRQPLAVTDYANTFELAVNGAINKIKISLETILGRLRNH